MAKRYNLGNFDDWWDEGEQDNPSRKVPERLMRHLVVDLDLDGAEIVRLLADQFDVGMTRANISRWRTTRGLPPRVRANPHRRDLIPWRVKGDHQGDRWYRFLLCEARYRAGGTPDEPNAYRYKSIKRELARRPGMVIFYDREDGFRLIPKRDCDKDLIWDPRLS